MSEPCFCFKCNDLRPVVPSWTMGKGDDPYTHPPTCEVCREWDIADISPLEAHLLERIKRLEESVHTLWEE